MEYITVQEAAKRGKPYNFVRLSWSSHLYDKVK